MCFYNEFKFTSHNKFECNLILIKGVNVVGVETTCYRYTPITDGETFRIYISRR